MAHRYDSWESYFYPETIRRDEQGAIRGGTLRNLFHFRDGGMLAAVEYTAAEARGRELATGEVKIPQTFDAAHLKAIHRHLLQDVYDWAGEYRTVNMWKGKAGFAIVEKGRIDLHLEEASRIVRSTDWRSLQHGQFATQMAAVYSHVNQAHPFREGNGRATKRYLRDVAELSPFRLDFTRVDVATWNARADASRPEHARYFNTNPAPMVHVFETVAVRRPVGAIDDDRAIDAAMQRLMREDYPSPGRTTRPPRASHAAPAAGYYDERRDRGAGGAER